MGTQSLNRSSGWWNAIQPADVDGDGDTDFIVGNLGKNSRIVADEKQPAELYVHDFDKNGTVEQIISCYTENGKSYPMVLKNDLQKQMPGIRKKYIKYADYAGKQIQDILPAEELKQAVVKKVTNSNTSLLINEGGFQFTLKPLPIEAQFSPVFSIDTLDYNQDGILDIVLAGNFFDVLPEIGRYDASYGLVLQGKGKGQFGVIKSKDSGFFAKGQVRRMRTMKAARGQTFIILAKNNDQVQIFGYKKKK